MQQEVIRQREIIDMALPMLKEINELNQVIKDDEFKTDMLCLIGQHRHTFEDQNVADHSECISIEIVTGSYEGVCGGLMYWASSSPMAKRAILETAYYILNKK